MPATTRPLFEQIDSWLQEIDTTKTAAAKPASSKTGNKKANVKKAGPSGMGDTSHPSEDVENNTQDEETGERYEENSSDVKKDVPGQAVDETDPKSGGSQDDKQFNIGTEQSATGEDPSVEDDYKGDKDDPGTSHPMNADDVGEKYSSMKLKQLIKLAEDRAHILLADLANGINVGSGQSVKQKVAAVKAAQPAPATPVATSTVKTAVASGYDASTAAGAVDLEKIASDFVAQTIHDANLDADLVGSFLHSYHQSRTKRADDEGSEGEDHGGGAPPPADPAAGGGGDVLSALGAGAGGPPGGDPGMPPGAGGPPPDAGGPPPGGDAGGPPGGGGGMNQEQALQELAMALQELGISPEELAHMAQSGGGGGPPGAGGPPMGGPPDMGGGGPPPDMGGGPPPGAGPEGAKLASAVKRFKLAGKFKVEEAKTAAQRQARDQIKDYIRDLTGHRS